MLNLFSVSKVEFKLLFVWFALTPGTQDILGLFGLMVSLTVS